MNDDDPNAEYNAVEDFVSGRAPKAVKPVTQPATPEPAQQAQRTAHTPHVHVPEALLEVIKDARDSAAIVAYAKEILRRRGDSPLTLGIVSEIGTIYIPVEAITDSDSGMVAVRVRTDQLRMTLKDGATLHVELPSGNKSVIFVGSLKLADNVDMLVFIPHNNGQSQDYDQPRS